MGLEDLDIVYCLKENSTFEEFKYSLRSLKNFPHRRVWVYGGCPEWINPATVTHVPVIQNKGNKWLNTSFLFSNIVQNDEITEDFVWFNDDFFVLQEIEQLPYYYDRTLAARVMDLRKKFGRYNNGYMTRLATMARALKWDKRDTLNFELHLPMIFNRKKLANLIRKNPGVAKRSLYGNYYAVNPIQRNDVKIYDNLGVPDETWDFVSTSDDAFANGKVGKYLKKKFKARSIYES